MITKETDYLSLMKDELERKYKETYPECTLKITEWRQQEIVRFQKLMQDIVKGRISEKWFYTHIKPEQNTKMPRIDTLNLLAEFLGYENWERFKNEKGELKRIRSEQKKGFIYKNRITIIVLIIIMTAIGIAYSAGIFSKNETYKFCFVDADTSEPIESKDIEISLLHEDQSPEIISCDENACFEIETKDEKISFTVKALYYKTDTITRLLEKKKQEVIKLKQDDYALMIHVFSTSKIKDWEKQRSRLDKMIAEDAEIYQIDYDERGIEIYNKHEFIDKMTMPLNSLKNIEIIEVTYKQKQISMMRFIQKSI